MLYGYHEAYYMEPEPPAPTLKEAVVVAAILKHQMSHPGLEQVRVSVDMANRILWLDETLYTFKELGF
jgi:hypothetical protein